MSPGVDVEEKTNSYDLLGRTASEMSKYSFSKKMQLPFPQSIGEYHQQLLEEQKKAKVENEKREKMSKTKNIYGASTGFIKQHHKMQRVFKRPVGSNTMSGTVDMRAIRMG